MQATKDVLREELVLLGCQADCAEDVLRRMAEVLYTDGAVKETYFDAMMAREAKYPTGLPTEGIRVALPHADVEHVNYSALAVAVLDRPVCFCQMDDPNCQLEVELIFMLANADPAEQVQMLRTLVDMFDEPESLLSLKRAATPVEVVHILRTAYGLRTGG